MKLIKLIFNILQFVLNIIYALLISPWIIRKVYINQRWRKSAKVGDRCYFDNMAGAKTWVQIYKIVGETCGVTGDSFSRWIDLEDLKII